MFKKLRLCMGRLSMRATSLTSESDDDSGLMIGVTSETTWTEVFKLAVTRLMSTTASWATRNVKRPAHSAKPGALDLSSYSPGDSAENVKPP